MKRFRRSILILFVVIIVMSITVTVAAEENYPVLEAKVVEVQKYGNLTMDLAPAEFYEAGYELGDMLEVTFNDKELKMPFVTSYSDVDTDSLLIRDDQDSDLIVVAINMGDFASTYNVEVGDELTFALHEKEGYLSEYLLHQLSRTYERSDYETDSIYANFRSIATTGINPGVMYRSSSPINNELNRAQYADTLSEAVGIETVINLSDSEKIAEEYMAEQGNKSDYYKSLYEDGKVITLDMGVDISGQEFGKKLAEGLKFLSENEGPYLIHCTEGKDRAGFVAALLEVLMGASLEEIVTDYMTTYENYYGVQEGSEQYKAIAESNIMISLTTVIVGAEKGADISDVDLTQAAEDYLKRIGMNSDEIAALKNKLSAESIYKKPSVTAEVEEIEKYGHASTDILIEDFYEKGFEKGDMVAAIFDNGFVLKAPFLDGYYVETGDPLVRAYPGHTNIAVCINYGKLNEVAEVEVGDKLTIMLSKADGYKVQYEIRKLERTNNREDYFTDEEFANFRNLSIGNIAEGVLYRSSSPINNELNRAAYSDDLIQKAQVKTVVNMADSEEDIAEYRSADDFNSPYYAELYDKGQVLTLNMGLAYSSDQFRENIIKGLKFMARNEGPYLFHCTEGKDRAGFMGALLGALMGASKDEIVEDYMESYVNYYGVKKGTEKYKIISEDVLSMLKVITEAEDLNKADLTADSKSYLLDGGMTVEEITILQDKLAKGVTEAKTAGKVITVTKGDCLWNLAQDYLGNGAKYKVIYELNKDIIDDPSIIFVGQELKLPAN